MLRALQAEIAEIQATDTAPLVHPSILFSKRQTNNHFSKLSVKTSLPKFVTLNLKKVGSCDTIPAFALLSAFGFTVFDMFD